MRFRASRVAAVAVFVAASPQVARAGTAPGESACAALRQLHVPGVVLSDVTAQWLPAGSPPPAEPPWVSPLTVPLPAYCRLGATIDARTGADGKSYGIGFALALPAEWNGRFLFQGGGGLNGSVAPPLGRTGRGEAALSRGFAVVTTDTGHRGEVFDASFMADQQASLDFAYQAVGRVAALAKQVLALHYGTPPAHSYFMGCSTGGREGMLMAQRHPTYFDGIVVGAPAMRTSFSGIGDEWVATMLNRVAPPDDAGKPDGSRAFSPADRKAVTDGLLAACDGADGLQDGIVADPIGCRFDPASLRCAGAKADGCLSAAQVEALGKAFAGPKDSKGRQVYPGFLFDTGITATQGIPGLLAGSANPVGPRFTATEMNVDERASRAAADPQAQLTSTWSWTKLNTFSGRGGKLLFYHGVSDPWFSALDTLDYYERLTGANGGPAAVAAWSRLFLVPGMGHCGGGPAALDSFDMLGAMVDWVESQKPPQAIRATGRAWPGRSRLLCPYPSHAHYRGTGDVEDAASFECRSSTDSSGQTPEVAPYLDPALPPERRAADLVSRMTLEEKVLQMQSTAPAIERLGVAAYNWWNEALHGVVQGRATVFPQAIGLAATWDTDLMYRVADIISTEARAKYNDAETRPAPSGPETLMTLPGRTAGLTYWSPNINIFRDPRWGRGQETYGEDPYLTGRMAVAFVRGMEGNDPRYLKVVATPKHYAVHSGPEPERHRFDAAISESDLVNTYLPAFRAAVVEGKAHSVMCVYNAVNGTPGCASADLLQKRLRDEWGFQGYVVSDCGAVKDIHQHHKYTRTLGGAAVAAVKAGTDLTCGTEYKTLVEEVQAGRITEAELDRSLERLMVARFRLGMFDPKEQVPYSAIALSENDSSAHRQAAREAARAAIVLLKNDGGVLPLRPSVASVAVIGPSADDPVALLGNYHGISSKQVTPLEGLARQFPAAQVRYALGATYTARTHALLPSAFLAAAEGAGRGVWAEYFDNPDLQGEPRLRRLEPRPYFDMGMEDPAVVAAVGREKYSVRFTAVLTPPATGEYDLTVRTGMWNRTATARLFLDEKELDIGPGPTTRQTSTQPPPGPRRPPHVRVRLNGGRKYALRVEYRQPGSGGTVQLGWIPPAGAALAEAVALAKESDVAILFVGLSAELEGEEMRGVDTRGFKGGDRTRLDLPEPQERLVKAVIATGKPVVVVLTSGSAVAVNSAAERAAALVVAWYGGEEAGTAIAETLAGASNPAGRLPVTFYKSEKQLPAFTDYAMKGRTYRYFKGEPLYPFGYGLSYSTFAYSGLAAQRTPKGAEVRATVTNTSARDGDEVVQLYVGGGPGAEAPLRTLRGFRRIHLRAGESRELSFTLAAEDLPQGTVEVSVGGGQPAGSPHVKGAL